jgi:hypothetical protein
MNEKEVIVGRSYWLKTVARAPGYPPCKPEKVQVVEFVPIAGYYNPESIAIWCRVQYDDGGRMVIHPAAFDREA